MTDTSSYDVIIIGGGVYGCATAWELAKRGASAIVLERDEVASGASGGLGKRGVRANGRDPRELPLMRDAYELWPELASRLDGPTGYERTGHLELYERDRDLPVATARARAQRGLGIATNELDPAEALALEPMLASGIQLALHAPLDGIADHTATTRSYARAAQILGATVREKAEVRTLIRAGNSVIGVELRNGERMEAAQAVVVLANAGTPALLERTLGVELPVWSILPQVMRTEALSEPLVRGLVGHAHRVLSVKALPDNSVMVSGGWRGRWNPTLGQGESVPDQIEGNWAEATTVFPRLDGQVIAEVSAERLETSCIDGVPIIDRAPNASNVFFGCGWCGHGWAIAPAIAPLLAQWVLENERPAPLAPFSFDRFCA